MELKVIHLHIATGGILVAVLNRKDAMPAQLREGDRITIKKPGKKPTVAIVDITSDEKIVPPGSIGLFNETAKERSFHARQKVQIAYATKPESIFLIKKKLMGKRLTQPEIKTIMNDIANNRLTDTELTYFVSAGYMHEFSDNEVTWMTQEMIAAGETLNLKDKKIMDKHCIGGVAGNRTTCVVVPIIAAAGLPIPKTSSRSITSPAGTADTMEVLCDVSLPIKEVRKVVKKTGGCLVWGGAMNLAPADDKIIKVEHPLSLDPVGQLLVSILAKKKSVGATHCLIDIPFGKGAKISDKTRANLLRQKFQTIGKKLGMNVKVVITDGTEPIGNGIGPALEAKDIIWTLQNDPQGSHQLKEKAIKLGGVMLEMGGKAKKGAGEMLARELIENGTAYKKFSEIVQAQGGKKPVAEKIKVGKHTRTIRAAKRSVITNINNAMISTTAKLAGAPKDKGAGIFLYHHVGDYVEEDDPLFTIYADNDDKLQQAVRYAGKHIAISLKSRAKRQK